MLFIITWIVSLAVLLRVTTQWLRKPNLNQYYKVSGECGVKAAQNQLVQKEHKHPLLNQNSEKKILAIAEPSRAVSDSTTPTPTPTHTVAAPPPALESRLVWLFYPKKDEFWTIEEIASWIKSAWNGLESSPGEFVLSLKNLHEEAFPSEILRMSYCSEVGKFPLSVNDQAKLITQGCALYAKYESEAEAEKLLCHFRQIAAIFDEAFDLVIINHDIQSVQLEKNLLRA